MDGNMAEGISMSPQTCTFPQDLQETYAPEGSSSLSFSHLHVNDLGLTPSPGSQQQKPVYVNGSSGDGDQDDGTAVAGEALPKHTSQEADGLSANNGEALYDPLFDSDFGFHNFDSAFSSQKRHYNEAFPEDFGIELPEKRQAQDKTNQTDTAPNDTPSLSPDSSHRPEYAETALNTPDGIGRSQTPNSFFESLDVLFQDPTFQASLGNDDSTADLDLDAVLFDDLLFRPSQEISHAQPVPAPFAASDATKQRFSLDTQDLAANTSREILQGADVPQYTSPYPQHRGTLGYLPSAPGLHVKFVEVAEERMNFRMECLRHRANQLRNERNRYKNFYEKFSTMDEKTGESKQEMLVKENSMLRRVYSRQKTRQQDQAEQFKKEIWQWKARLNHVATLYNNLLYDVSVQRKLPEIAQPPHSYTPRPVQGVFPAHSGRNQPSAGPRQSQLPGFPQPVPNQPFTTGPPQNQNPSSGPGDGPALGTATLPANQFPPPSQPPSYPAPPDQCSQAVMIDLTDDDRGKAPNTRPAATNNTGGTKALQSLQQKKYHWLGEQDQMQAMSHHGCPSAPSVSTNEPGSSNNDNNNHNNTSGDFPPTAAPQTIGTESGGNEDEEDELARMMEEELAQCS